jgi:glycyl-tRNA synthetase beta subunit
LLGLADKLDNLLACFATGRVPTSTKDPYGLRRAAIGLLRICFENNIDLHLREALKALSIHMPKRPTHDQIEALITFILGRMEALFIHEGFTKTEIAATIPSPQIGLCDLLKRLHAVHALKESADFAVLNEVFKRASGQVKGIELPTFNTDLVQEPEEIELEKALGLAESRFESSCDAGDYRSALEALVGLKEPLHLFFDAVRVQCDEPDIRGNRLAMLGRILAMSHQLAHIQEI